MLFLHGQENLIKILVEMLFERRRFQANVFSHSRIVGMGLGVADIFASIQDPLKRKAN